MPITAEGGIYNKAKVISTLRTHPSMHGIVKTLPVLRHTVQIPNSRLCCLEFSDEVYPTHILLPLVYPISHRFIYFLIDNDLLLVTKQSGKPADSLLDPNTDSRRTSEILYGAENAVGRGVQFMQNVKKKMDIFFDYRAPSIVVDIEEYRNGYRDIRRRGARIRAFTEITKENIHYCKELMKMV